MTTSCRATLPEIKEPPCFSRHSSDQPDMYQSNRAPSSFFDLPLKLLSKIGHCTEDADLLSVSQLDSSFEIIFMDIFFKRTKMVDYGDSSLFLAPRCNILRSAPGVAMLLHEVLGHKEQLPVHLTLQMGDLLEYPSQVYCIANAISTFSSVDLLHGEEEQVTRDGRLPGAVVRFLASLGSCDEIQITKSWVSSGEAVQPIPELPTTHDFSPYLSRVKDLMEGVLSVKISGEFLASGHLKNVCTILMQGEEVRSFTVDNIEQGLFDEFQPFINFPALRSLHLGAHAGPLIIPPIFFLRHSKLRSLCLSSHTSSISQAPSLSAPQIFPRLDRLSVSTDYLSWKLMDPALTELYVKPHTIRASSGEFCSAIDSISRCLVMATNNGHRGMVSVRFPDFNGVSRQGIHTSSCTCSKPGLVSNIRRLAIETTTFDLIFLVTIDHIQLLHKLTFATIDFAGTLA